MTYVLINVEGGLIDEVTYFDDEVKAIDALAAYVKNMNPEKQDAAVHGPHGMLANAKDFLDDHDAYIDRRADIRARIPIKEKPVYVIGNPKHPLGFMVTSPDDPLGYRDPVEAVADLGLLRKDRGSHLKLYRLVPAIGPLATRQQVTQHNQACAIEDFEYGLVKEFLE